MMITNYIRRFTMIKRNAKDRYNLRKIFESAMDDNFFLKVKFYINFAPIPFRYYRGREYDPSLKYMYSISYKSNKERPMSSYNKQ